MARPTTDIDRLVTEYVEMWNERAYSAIPTLVSESVVVYNATLPDGEARGHDGLEEWMRQVTAGFPDFRVEHEDVLADDDTAMAEVNYTMTHEGEFGGIPPTGREIALPGMVKLEIEDGRIREHRDYVDRHALYEQLGVAEE